MTTKQCTVCLKSSPEDQFYDRKSECMTCTKERNARYRKKHRDGQKKSPYPVRIKDDTKQCNACDTWLPFTSFSPCETGQGGLQTKCKTCINAIYRAKYSAGKRAIAEKEKAVSRIEKHWNFT